ncbi:MAG: aromatic ring-hydroxylating dioxygenase subunit alpha [Acidimicrobiia bacterium]|nr:aromatic ring-hydroxylating dioxygenase subunit alpha [Acidimicrobiia bacterium]
MIHNCWYAAGFSTEFEVGKPSGHTIADRPMVAWRSEDGEVGIFDARCAHKRFPLWDGKILEGDILQCPYHGFAYDLTGQCVDIPALRDRSDRLPERARIYKYPSVEQDGLVWVWPGDPAASTRVTPPRTPEIASDSWETGNTEPMPVAAAARLLIENLLDLTHFYPLHSGNIGSRADAEVAVDIERSEENGIPVIATYRPRKDFVFPPMTRDRFGVEIGDQLQTHRMVGPAMFHVIIAVAPPGKLGTAEERSFVLYQTITPVDDEHVIWRRSINTPAGSRWAKDPDRSLLDVLVETAPTVVQEDLWALEEQQKMVHYPDGPFREVHIRTDGPMMMARRVLDEMERSEHESASR